MLRVWALHLSLRSDLGIRQPEWESAVEKARKTPNGDFSEWAALVKAYPWERLLVHSTNKLETERKAAYLWRERGAGEHAFSKWKRFRAGPVTPNVGATSRRHESKRTR